MTGFDPPHLTDRPESQPGPSAQIVEEVLAGTEKIVSHDGTSQYEGGGIASCGLAGLNFVRLVFGRVEEGLQDVSLLEDLLSRRTSEVSVVGCLLYRS
jgi:hypothetical protein